jgi:diguanylate cyclase (GGDEF)-like protein
VSRPSAPGSDEDVRNRLSARTQFRAYVSVVAALGLSVLALQVRGLDPLAVASLGWAFWLVCALLLVGELRPLFTAGTKDVNGIALSVTFLFALLLGFGLVVTVVAQAVAVIAADVVKRRAVWRTAFNIGQYTLCWTAAATAMSWLGHRPTVEQPVHVDGGVIAVAVVGAAVYFVLNQLLVTQAIAMVSEERLHDVLLPELAREVTTNGALLTLSPLVLLAVEGGPGFVPLLLPPLLAVYKVADISVVREREALTDLLTGLPNRKALVERTEELLAEQDAAPAALLLFDLDRFKEVNDTLGHHAGDALLAVIGQRLTSAVRPADTVARLGGDEFAVLLPGAGPEEAVATGRRLVERVCEPIELEGLLVHVGASMGVAVSPDHGTHLEELLQRADVAMYLAKDAGGGVEVYDVSRDRHSAARLTLVGELRRALAEGQLELHYQPKAEMADGRVIGVEALVRWAHPVRGLLPPDEFVPEAERSGLMPALTSLVVDAAVRQVRAWSDQGLRLRMAVNISASDLADEQFPVVVAEALDRHGVSASFLQLEVTEGSLLLDPARTAPALQRLGELGVTLSLDDFGTGWSSLSHLRRLPLHEVKVDRSFVERMDVDARDLAIVKSVLDLAEGLGMRVVAEGVETEQTWDRLRELGCHAAQGWYLAKAMPADRLTPWLQERSSGVPLGPIPQQSRPSEIVL